MAGEQSSGTFVPVPGETPELKARSAARVERLEILEERIETPTLPTTAVTSDVEIRRARATLSWPIENFGASLPNLLATVAGNRTAPGFPATVFRLLPVVRNRCPSQSSR